MGGRTALAGLIALSVALEGAAQAQTRAAPKIPIRVVVVTTFEIGKDAGDTPGEFQAWVERLPLTRTVPFPVGNRSLRYNPGKHVLGVVVGSGSVNSAASIMALGLDPRFDLTHAYWVVAGIAGVNPNQGSVGSAAWAEWVVDRDLSHEIDAREIPPDWTTGVTPLNRSRPFEGKPPPKGIYSPVAYRLNPKLVDWAFELTKDIPLADTADLKAIRANYPQAQARTPPRVMKGDEVTGMNWWLGAMMNKIAEDWMAYWTGGKGLSVTTAMEDSGVIHSLQQLQQARLVDADRILVLRTASNYSVPGAGQTAAELLASEEGSAHKLSAYIPALDAAYRVGSTVVDELSDHWSRYRDKTP